MICELCGKKSDKLYNVIIEGAELMVCESCKKFGKDKTIYSEKKLSIQPKKQVKDILETVIEDFPKILKDYREKHNLTQEEMAKKLGIKFSLYKGFEEGRIIPDIETAKKIEKILKIKIVKVDVLYTDNEKEDKKYDLTIGDILEVKFD